MSSLVPDSIEPTYSTDSTDSTDAVEGVEGVEGVEAVKAVDVADFAGRDEPSLPGPVSPRTRFLEVSRRYLLETGLPAPRDPAWPGTREAMRPWLSSRAARRSPAWPVASAPWGRR